MLQRTLSSAAHRAATPTLLTAGAFFSILAGFVNKRWGRKITMVTGGAAFCIGAILCAFAQDLAMLVIGRVMLGWGVGFANQAVPLYLSEIAPAHIRGTLNIMFQMATTIGELGAPSSLYSAADVLGTHP